MINGHFHAWLWGANLAFNPYDPTADGPEVEIINRERGFATLDAIENTLQGVSAKIRKSRRASRISSVGRYRRQ